MVVFVNPYASAGKGITKWEMIRDQIAGSFKTEIIKNSAELKLYVESYLKYGERNFAAAGGDGTINLLLNDLINSCSVKELSELKLGAIGTGSSNDFHKPFQNLFRNIPLKINFDDTELHDIGIITINNNGKPEKKYFLINASIGITAEANYFFNNPDFLLSRLKRINTQSAIMYAALHSILKYRNFEISICSTETGKKDLLLTNIGIVKNPNFSGNLKFSSNADYSSGKLTAHLCFSMNTPEIIKFFIAVQNGSFEKIKKKISWETSAISVSSKSKFKIEFDGEIIESNNAEFSILPQKIKVCR